MAVQFENDLEKLFLLEILVDKVKLDYSQIGLDSEVFGSLKQTCIRFQFLNYPGLDICEEDFCTAPEEDEKSEIFFGNGKSCLFSLKSSMPELKYFKIRAVVMRKKEKPPPLVLGRSCIGLGKCFAEILNSVQAGNEFGPVTETIKDKYFIHDEKGKEIGSMLIFIRLSCFGKMIVTQFQINDEKQQTLMYKGGNQNLAERSVSRLKCGNSVCQDRSVPGVNFPVDPSGVTLNRGQGGWEYQQLSGYGDQRYQVSNYGMTPSALSNQQYAQSAYGAMPYQPTAYDANYLQYLAPGFGGPGYQQYNGYYPTDPYLAANSYPTGLLGGSMDTSGYPTAYKNIGLVANGQPLDIMVQKSFTNKNVSRQHPYCGLVSFGSDESSSSEEEEEIPRPQPLPFKLNLCECDYPLPPGFVTPCPTVPQPKKKKKKKKKQKKCPLEFDAAQFYKAQQYYGGGGATQNYCTQMIMEPGTIALTEDQVIFQTPFPQPLYTNPYANRMAYDPSDYFSLKVGRKLNVLDQNTKVELQYKSIDDKNKCPKVDAEVQYNPIDFGGTVESGKPDKKKKKGKGKGKGKKKKK